ncbi:hypothetical protein GCM10022409_21630 [Hymenobacter glaciei]|uniref:Uncharacterized protein n=1 Tax=Hymenobacter glaciei TaxID=877209 RepID=A0ABP7U618_9BACT
MRQAHCEASEANANRSPSAAAGSSSFLLHGQPYKLLLVSTGSVSTIDLLELFRQFLPQLTRVLTFYSYVEMSRTMLTTHR